MEKEKKCNHLLLDIYRFGRLALLKKRKQWKLQWHALHSFTENIPLAGVEKSSPWSTTPFEPGVLPLAMPTHFPVSEITALSCWWYWPVYITSLHSTAVWLLGLIWAGAEHLHCPVHCLWTFRGSWFGLHASSPLSRLKLRSVAATVISLDNAASLLWLSC